MRLRDRHPFRPPARPFRIAVTLAVTLLAWAGSASAQVPNDSSAVDQYVEDQPTAAGPTVPGTRPPTQTTLPPSVATQIQTEGGDDAAILNQVATSSAYGAPQRRLRKDDSSGGATAAGEPRGDVSAGEAVSAVVSAVQGGDAARLVGLLFAMLLISLAALTAAGVRQKRRSSA